jgi:hypothetical protein
MADNPYLEKIFSFYLKPIWNTIPDKSISIYDLIDLIRTKFEKETEELRGLKKNEKGKFKTMNFDYITISGVFENRRDAELIKHSGLIIIDIDDIEAPEQIKKTIKEKCEYFLIAFTSPGGAGVKVVYQIDLNENTQAEWYEGYSKYLIELLNLSDQKIDKSGKDVSRACFLGYDPDLIVNPKLLQK